MVHSNPFWSSRAQEEAKARMLRPSTLPRSLLMMWTQSVWRGEAREEGVRWQGPGKHRGAGWRVPGTTFIMVMGEVRHQQQS